ncbi:MAG: xanthine dehydrogenase family protein subunit M, partial [Alphaproteobacteria bacterium]
IGPDELLTRVRVPSWAVGHGYGFAEFARRHGDFAIVSAAALLEITGGSISRAAIAIGGADVRPIRLEEAETALVGQAANAESFKAAGEMARKIDAISDAYVSSAYRQRLAATMVERALVKAGSRAGGSA